MSDDLRVLIIGPIITHFYISPCVSYIYRKKKHQSSYIINIIMQLLQYNIFRYNCRVLVR